MNNWQDNLLKKSQELNLKKEDKNDVHIETNNNLSDRDSGGGRRDVNLSNIHKEIIKVERRNISMISAEAAKGDFIKLTDEAKSITALSAAVILILKGMLVLLKVILTTRTNTVKILDKLGIAREEKKENVTENPNSTSIG